MQGRFRKMTIGGKSVKDIGSFSISGYIPPLEDLFKEAEEITFVGKFDPTEEKPAVFEIGKIYDLSEHMSGMRMKAKCISIDRDYFHFKIIEWMRKN